MALFSPKQAQLFGSAVKAAKEAGAFLGKHGKKVEKVVGSKKGQYVIKTTAGKAYKLYKKKGLGALIKEGPKLATDVGMKAWLAKPKMDFGQKYAKYKKDFEFKHTADPAIHEAKGVKLQSMVEWAKDKVAGIHYKGELPQFDKMGGYLGQKATKHLWKKVAKGSAFGVAGLGGVAALGYAADKGNVSGYAEGPKGTRVEGFSKTLRVHNPSGAGGHWAAGATVKAPGRVVGTGGFNVGIGHAEKAGLAHQVGGHLHLTTPLFKTGIKGESQSAFGLKSRSRRVAAIRRATFGSEQHLGVSKKASKSQRAKDTLYY
jgi:hypothetical protein